MCVQSMEEGDRGSSSFAPTQSILHLLLYMIHLLGPLLGQTLLIISDDGGIAHQGNEANAEQVGEPCAEALHRLVVALRVPQVDL